MSKKTGRPPKAIIQEKFLGFFVTNLQHFVIQQKMAEARVNKSDYLRQVALNGYVKARWTAEEREMFKKIVAISSDINELVILAKQEGILSAVVDFTKYRNLVDEIINRLCHDE